MPSIECKCLECSHMFKQIVFRGDEDQPVICPECKSDRIKLSHEPPGLFNGISNFSSLAGDTN
jgi:hypothetical protein